MDMIRWPYRSDMVIRKPDGTLGTYRIQWLFSDVAAKPLPYPHGYGSSNYYDPNDINIDGPGEIVETGRVRNRKAMTSTHYNPKPCPDDGSMWNPQE